VKLRLAAVVLAAAALAGCASAGAGGGGRATIWVTRDEGARVLLVRSVPAGLTAMQALQRVARVETRYGGRFVQAIGGLAGSSSGRQDWFYFVNGYEADRGAAEYRLHDGDVEWWDYRSWQHRMREPVVIGAFPEPFLHGYGGKARPAAVVFDGPELAGAAWRLARVVRASKVVRAGTRLPKGMNQLVLEQGPPAVRAQLDGRGAAGDPVRFVVSGKEIERVAARPRFVRFRYELPR
jgi:Domain of unknown function (DUF4430)